MRPVVTFGEIMLRLSTPGYQRFIQAQQYDVHFGGGEANVAVSLAQFGVPSVYVTRLPQNDLGDAALNSLRQFGVDTSHIVRGGERIGIYFLETGASQRASKIIYDRKGSSLAVASPDMFAWDECFAGAGFFHITGITPALSASAAETVLDAVRAARRNGVSVTLDLNYRRSLWSPEEAGRSLAPLAELADVLIANEEHLQLLFGIEGEGSDASARLRSAGERTMRRFPSLRMVTMTRRDGGTSTDNDFGASLWDGRTLYQSRRYTIRIVDRVGGGDSFSAGLIYGLAGGRATEAALEFAAAAACLKHTIPGDFNFCSVAEVDALVRGDAGGRVQR